jgi:hypothetical protein
MTALNMGTCCSLKTVVLRSVIGLETTGLDTERERFLELKAFPVKALNNFCFEVIRSPL